MGYPYKNTITLSEAEDRQGGPLAFNLMVKPVGSVCNLGCRYCYYLDKSEIYGGVQPKMSVDMLETVVREYIAANDVPEITFCWHGGEPLLMELDFYRKAVEFQKKYADGKTIHNSLQTNGTLITPETAMFFSKNDFLIGISIDGPEEIHDNFRRDRRDRPTFDVVMNGLQLLVEYNVEFNTLTAVSHMSENRGLEVYDFLKSVGSRYMQFMPVVEYVRYLNGRPYIVSPSHPDAVRADWSVSSFGFGRFMCDIFDFWVSHDVGKYFVSLFDATLANHCGIQPGMCVHAATCGGNLVVEHNGDVYPCDHFVYPEYRLGNLTGTTLRNMAASEIQHSFGLDKRNRLPAKCCSCRYGGLCHGECPKHRFDRTDAGDAGLSSLCSGYHMFFEHTEPYMLQMKKLLKV